MPGNSQAGGLETRLRKPLCSGTGWATPLAYSWPSSLPTTTTTTTPAAPAATMSEEGYPASNWEHTDSDHPSSTHHAYNSAPYISRDSLDVPGVPLTPTKSASPPRSSVESPTRGNNFRWRDSVPQPANSSSGLPPAEDGILDTSFDENVLRALCNLDVRPCCFDIVSLNDAEPTPVRRSFALGPNKTEHDLLQSRPSSRLRPCPTHNIVIRRLPLSSRSGSRWRRSMAEIYRSLLAILWRLTLCTTGKLGAYCHSYTVYTDADYHAVLSFRHGNIRCRSMKMLLRRT